MARTAAQERRRARDIRSVERSIARQARAAAAARLREIAARRKEALSRVRVICARGRQIVKHRAARRRAELAQKLREEIASEKERIKLLCATRREGVMATARTEAQRVRLEAQERKRTDRMLRARERDLTKRDRMVRKTQRAERVSESDDAVLAELPPELHGVWERNKKRFRGSEKWSRAEQFLHWVEENPDEVIAEQSAAIDASTARELAELTKVERSIAKRLAKPSRRGAAYTYTDAEIEGLRRLGIDPFAPRAAPALAEAVPF